MNDKILTMALMLSLVMIGINAFLLMASTNLYDTEGNQLDIYYGLDSGAYGSQVQTDAQSIDFDSGVSISSELPSEQEGLTVVSRNDNPIGMDVTNELAKLGLGVQLVMLKFSEMFPVLTPIVNAVVFFAFAIQGLAIAYLGSILIRGILGRIT
jgi:hypothetical protein